MANNLIQILTTWQAKKDQHDWVLATIYATDGSSYRKSGAHMMINDMGQYFGLLSGGCLESDIMRQARRCWDTRQSRLIKYDMREEEDLAWQLGIGCGGLVKILLQPVNAKNDYLLLNDLLKNLRNRIFCQYRQQISDGIPLNHLTQMPNEERSKPQLVEQDGKCFLEQILCPPFHLTLVGGGGDARPVVRFAKELGWEVVLVDPRPSHARREHFGEIREIVKSDIDNIKDNEFLVHTNAVVIMSHSIDIDAQALFLAMRSSATYVGLLGPGHRTKRVFERAGLVQADYPIPLANPIGLRLGGDLPESIALSIISEVHAFLEQTDAKSISSRLD